MSWRRPGQKGVDFIHCSNARFNIASGAVRSGKTVCQYLRILKYLKEAPPGPIAFIGKTERTLKRNIIDPMQEALGEDNLKVVWGQKGEGRLFGRLIYVVGANDERSAGKIQGGTLAGAIGDEIALWPESFYVMLKSRLSLPGSKFFGTTNPGPPTHWLKKDMDREDLQAAGDIKTWHFLLEDNPYLDKSYVESLKREYIGLWYQRYILGKWVAAEGAIFDFFDKMKHCWYRDPGFKVSRRWISIDYGTINPCTFGLYGINREDAPVPKIALESEYYYDSKARENYGRQKTDRQYADDLIKFIGNAKIDGIIVDPSAASFIAELESRGMHVTHAKNDVLNGIRTEAEFLSNGQFKIHESCEKTIEETSGYVWDEKAAIKGEDKPIKTADHCTDRDRYMIYTLFGKPLNQKIAAVYNA